jgi:hypothetical protein
MILGISGLAGSGKDTVAEFLGKDLRFATVSFADPLKRIARDVYDFTDEQLWGPSANRNKADERYRRPHTWIEPGSPCACCGCLFEDAGDRACYLTPRYALQTLGTEWGRHCYPETWSEMGVRTAQKLLQSTQDGGTPGWHSLYYSPQQGLWQGHNLHEIPAVGIPDVRFVNEMEIIRRAGGKNLRVKRKGAGLRGGAALHKSEVEQASIPDELFDAVLVNDGTLDELRAKAHDTAVRLGARG